MPRLRALLVAAGSILRASAAECPGSFILPGNGSVPIADATRRRGAGADAGREDAADARDRVVALGVEGQSRFVDGRKAGRGSLELLGMTLRYTVDLSAAGCGCSAALHLSPLAPSRGADGSACADCPCDAEPSCREIAVQEANGFSWSSSWSGLPPSLLGTEDGYASGGGRIDTSRPFDVAVSFPTDEQGVLTAMEVELSQDGEQQPLSVFTPNYTERLLASEALRRGVTPRLSYSTGSVAPCVAGTADACSGEVEFHSFSIEPRPSKGCPGATYVSGHGKVSLINAMWNTPHEAAGRVEVLDGVMPHMKGRAYFGDTCSHGSYSETEYTNLQLLGQTLRYKVDLSGAGCGCDAALYLTQQRSSVEKSDCLDHYCDANNVCGLRCVEIDIQEANNRAFLATLHAADDGSGIGAGYGAYASNWDAESYGPGARCIDTLKPFEVIAAFPTDNSGILAAMTVTLQQQGSPCHLALSLGNYTRPDGDGVRDGMVELTEALRGGMTPIVSYWGEGEDLLWLDGPGPSDLGPCKTKDASCSETVRFFDFSVEPIPTTATTTSRTTLTATTTSRTTLTATTTSRTASTSTTATATTPSSSAPASAILPASPIAPADTTTSAGAGRDPAFEQLGPYRFAGYAAGPEHARQLCGQGRMAMPKTAAQGEVLASFVRQLMVDGRMSQLWPKNTLWIGGSWNPASGAWAWDDGDPVEELAWAPGQPSSALHPRHEPWLCMLDGHFYDSGAGIPFYSFGVVCEEADTVLATDGLFEAVGSVEKALVPGSTLVVVVLSLAAVLLFIASRRRRWDARSTMRSYDVSDDSDSCSDSDALPAPPGVHANWLADHGGRYA